MKDPKWKKLAGMTLLGCMIVLLAVDGSAAVENGVAATASKQKPGSKKRLDYIAIVGGERIGMREYVGLLRKGMRERFYHGKTPEGELKKYQKEIIEQLVSRLLSVQEAKRRGIKPDSEAVNKAVEAFDVRFKGDPKWSMARKEVLKQLKDKLQGDSLAELLEKQVRLVPEPGDIELRSYYEKHKDLFTTPARVRVSLILLKVDPSSGSAVWEQASKEANNILERINKGADFADMARIHSSDDSAQNGGDMGYAHSGMLGDNAQKVIDLMEPGEVSSPVILLEGVALFRMEGRVKSELNPLKSVRERAIGLYQRDKGEQAWKELDTKLRAKTKIEYNDEPWQ
jgi:parvulin-like peptidyl-prolyl isomerase